MKKDLIYGNQSVSDVHDAFDELSTSVLHPCIVFLFTVENSESVSRVRHLKADTDW